MSKTLNNTATAARIAVILEVVGVGFDGASDKTDDRVLWVGAPSVEIVAEMLNALNVPHKSISVTDHDPATVAPREVFDYEHDAAELVAALFRFALDDAQTRVEAGKPGRPFMCIELTAPHQFGVKVEQFANRRFRVTYGAQVRGSTADIGLGYAAAARDFGECVFHALACAGMLDNDGPL